MNGDDLSMQQPLLDLDPDEEERWTMDSNGNFARPLDESLARELPQLQSLRIAPLRHPVSSRGLSVPSPLEPNASVVRETKTSSSGGSGPTNLPPVTELPNTSSTAATTSASGSASQTKKHDDSMLGLEPPPKPILPAFVNPRALERFPYSSFDEDAHFSRKRRRLDLHAELLGDHLQLPIPQQQKEHRPPPFGPFAILNGLNEPPPNAALLPPIEAGSMSQLLSKPSKEDSVVEPALLTTNNGNATDSHNEEKREGRIEEILGSPIDDRADDSDHCSIEDTAANESRSGRADSGQIDYAGVGRTSDSPTEKSPEPLSPKTRGRSRKNLRKWTEEETTALLRGVVKCGIGSWKAILAQPELEFNKRSAANLKDRFRVCCPWAYRAADSNEAMKRLHDTLAKALQQSETGSGNTTEKVLLPHPRPQDSTAAPNNDQSTPSKPPKEPIPTGGSLASKDIGLMTHNTEPNPPSPTGNPPKLSNQSKSALASLGIPQPHYVDKPRKRSRRPFTTSEDEALLKGYAVHGFQWTSIQQDERLNLGHRKATDLRDRFRTKFPHAYREGGSVSGKSLNPQNQNKTSTSSTSDTEKGANTANQNVLHEAEPSTPSKTTPKKKNACSVDRTHSASRMGSNMDSTLPRPAPLPPLQGLSENPTGASPAIGAFPFHLDEPVVWDELA